MKNIFLTIGIVLLSFGNVCAQSNSFDKKLQKIDQTKLTSGIIYDRVLPLADLGIYNMPAEKPHNTADFRFFNQALFELHKASNYKKLISIKEIEEKISPYNKKMNIVPIGIINTPFQSLNFNPENPKDSGLIMTKDSIFEQVPEKEPFLNGYALVVAPLKNVMQGEQIIFKFSDDLILNNGDTKIKTLIADFGDGKKYKIFEEGKLLTNELKIENFKNNGDKTFHFSVTLSNDFTFSTNGKIFTVYGNAINNSSNTQPIACSSNNLITNTNLVQNFNDNYTEASDDDAFQGLNETVKLKGQIEPRVFYHTKNGTVDNNQKTLLKPILIIDGFDPSDGRKIDDCDCERDLNCAEDNKDKATGRYNPDNHTSFVESMEYTDNSTTPVSTKNLITVFREKGYDVILVNQPTYTTNNVTVDGGADFIERNAMAFVQLVKEVNTKLQTNGSTEKLVVMGPSMGGQISRYALAFMEKKFAETGLATWQHNTRIWVAFDSPNHGANVPLGNQALIKMLADAENSAEAKKSFNKLQSTAANEMLINYFQSNPAIDNQVSNYHYFNIDLDSNYSNASTTSQGMQNNTGNPYFKEHYNNQFNNGLPNSNGFPMNLRKLSIVNGSLTGETFGNGYEKILDIELFKTIRLIDWNIWGWHVNSIFHSKLFQAETYSMPTSNSIITRTEKLRLTDGNDTHVFNSYANSVRGNLDNVPGGSIDATGILYSSITGQPAPSARSFWQYFASSLASFYYNHIGFTPEWETHALKPDQCFIPTYSGIGIKNPNQSWSNPLNRNLVCSDETYFDSFFGESKNTKHVELNDRSVNWLLEELKGNPQVPHFPIQENALSGDKLICENQIKTYSIADQCKVPSPVIYTANNGTLTNGWSVEGNLVIASSTPYSVTVQGSGNGSGKVIATFQNGQKIATDVWVGKPSFYLSVDGPDNAHTFVSLISADANLPIDKQGITNVVIRRTANNGVVSTILSGATFFTRRFDPSTTRSLTVTVTNSCGVTTDFWSKRELMRTTTPIETKVYVVFPNPAKNIVNIELRNKDNQPTEKAKITASFFNMMGVLQSNVAIKNNIATIDVSDMVRGLYLLKIDIDGTVETHHISLQ